MNPVMRFPAPLDTPIDNASVLGRWQVVYCKTPDANSYHHQPTVCLFDAWRLTKLLLGQHSEELDNLEWDRVRLGTCIDFFLPSPLMHQNHTKSSFYVFLGVAISVIFFLNRF